MVLRVKSLHAIVKALSDKGYKVQYRRSYTHLERLGYYWIGDVSKPSQFGIKSYYFHGLTLNEVRNALLKFAREVA